MKLRFSIRDLLWLTALVALVLGWWVDHRRLTINTWVESTLSGDSTIAQLRWEISSLEFARSVQIENYIKESFDQRIAQRQRAIDERRKELLKTMP